MFFVWVTGVMEFDWVGIAVCWGGGGGGGGIDCLEMCWELYY